MEAKFVLSLDCELLWGSYSCGGAKRYKYLTHGFRSYYDQLLTLFDRYEIQATFAFVGSMALTETEFQNGVKQIKKSAYREWLNQLADTSSTNPSYWHDSEIIEKVLLSKQNHEIGSHSLTHLNFHHEACDRDAAQNEFQRSHDILSQRYNHEVKTFIFPENQINHLESFKSSPYLIYRSKDEVWYQHLPFKRLFHFLDQALPIAPNPVDLRVDSYGNHHIPGSLLFFPYDGIRRFIPDQIRYLKIKRGIDRAIREGKIFHFWFHPWNLGSSKRMIKLLEKILIYVSEKRSKGLLKIITIGDLINKA